MSLTSVSVSSLLLIVTSRTVTQFTNLIQVMMKTKGLSFSEFTQVIFKGRLRFSEFTQDIIFREGSDFLSLLRTFLCL